MAARRRRDNIVAVVLAVLAVMGGGHAILSVFEKDPPAPSDANTTAVVGPAQLAGAFAEQFVMVYLTSVAGQQDKVAEFVGGSGQQITLPTTAQQVSDPAVVYVSRDISVGGIEVWSVTVSVRIGRGATGDRQFLRVAVSVAEGRLRALSLPSVVQPPGRGAELATVYSAPCGEDTPLTQVASGFLAAFLTGSGDVGRYTTPESAIAALAPAPFTTLETAAVTADDAGCGTGGTTARVLATVNPKSATGASATLAYPLTMVNTTGQWQVQSMDPLPALTSPLAVVAYQDTRSAASQTTTPAPSTSVQIPPARQN
ncbi:conjugal transfer protein [Nocardia cyriacigeorgica]|uniref:conjugal transfer protein n=1 Tax=Nocardia cyriacigeorgica TaxID=135487 RepID=UPI002458FDC0|nr:conjugal transfer protein [Nocardia cyriacigeorgica]